MQALTTTHAKPPPQRAIIPYLLFQLQCDPGTDISAPVATALQIIRRPGCVCEANISTLMFVTFPDSSLDDATELRDEVASSLMTKLGPRVRLIKGNVAGVVGHIGRGNDCFRGSAFIGLEKLCTALFGQPFGTSVTKDLVPRGHADA